MESTYEINFEEEYLNEDTICSICNAEFLDLEDLEIHTKQVHIIPQTNEVEIIENLGKKCDFCTYNYTDLQNYVDHIRDEHVIGPLKVHFCKYCLRGFGDIETHRKHENKHQHRLDNKNIISCWKCNKKSVIEVIREHDKSHRLDDEGVFLQDLLPYLSAAFHAKASIVLESMTLNLPEFHCVGCGFKTSKLNFFLDHVKKLSCNCYVCYKCSNVYKRKTGLIRHIIEKCSESQKTCKTCNQPITLSKYLEHKELCKIFRCKKCSDSFENVDDYTKHLAFTHTSTLELQTCNFCRRECVGSKTLEKHINKSHKPYLHLYKYRCIDCDRVFKHPSKLFAHYFAHHRELTPYHCKICEMKFRIRKQFTLHIKLKHESKGFVEFDEKYHVFFDSKKSEHPFIPKSIYNNETNESIQEGKTDSDFIHETETDANQTEAEAKPSKPKLKRKKVSKRKRNDSQSSDDQPLLLLRRARKAPRNQNTIKIKPYVSKSQLVCQICDKYCYTVQNYNHHVNLHSKTSVKCIKCSKVFQSKKKLKAHVEIHHSTSKLTETLKSLLEKRKIGKTLADSLPNSEKFRRTIKKSQTDSTSVTATITETERTLSVQKFIENFTPDTDVRPSNGALTCKIVTEKREPLIKLTKFKPYPLKLNSKLAMPVKYKDTYDKVDISIKVIADNQNTITNFKHHPNFNDSDDDMNRNDIPDVAEEIETVTETPNNSHIQHQIIIPNIPKDIKDLSIAHLQPEAPFFKIVKVNDYLSGQNKPKPRGPISTKSPIKLPDGTKFVATNPLAHLLGTYKHKKNKYYKPKNADKSFQQIFAEALLKLDGKKKKGKKQVANSKVTQNNARDEETPQNENQEDFECL